MNTSHFTDLLKIRRSHRDFAEAPVDRDAVARLLWAAQGVTGINGGRTAPSAHALHPLRLFLTAGNIDGLEPAVYAAGADNPEDLTLHAEGDVRTKLDAAALEDQPWIAEAAGIITVSADLVAPTTAFADQPPYGTRGLRYVHIEAGAVAQNIHLQAATDGLACVLVAGFRDEATAEILRLEPPVAPILHMCFGHPV